MNAGRLQAGEQWRRDAEGDPASVRRSCDRGSATVLAVAAVAVLLLVLATALAVVVAVSARHRAQTAADLSALAAAGAAGRPVGPADPCTVAGRWAADNGAGLTSCTLALDGTVDISVAVAVPLLGATVTARARAGR